MTLLAPVIAYLAAMYGLALWSNRTLARSSDFMEEYFLGSRTMGGLVLAMTLVATYTSASSFIGGPGVAYSMGLGWVLLAMIQVPTAWLTLGVLGKRFAIIGRRIGAVNINDFLWARYRSKAVVFFGSLSLILFFIAAMVAQFIGGARLFESLTGLNYHLGLTLFALSVVLYTTVGGFRAVALTDTIQGFVMIAGTVAILWGTVAAGGGIDTIMETLRQTDPALLSPFGPKNFIAKPYILSFWVLVCFAVIGLPHTAVRCMGYRDAKSMHRAILIGTFVMGFLMLGMHLCGVFGRAILPELTVGDRIMPEITLHVLPPLWAGLFLAGPLAAIMSTVDSQLILASATLVKDLFVRYGRPGEPLPAPAERTLRRAGFATTALLGLIVFGASLKPPSLIVWINLFAFGGLQAAFLWPLVLGLYWRRANGPGALASMVTGVGSFFFLSVYVKRFLGMHVIAPTLIVALVVFVAVSLATRAPDEATLAPFWED